MAVTPSELFGLALKRHREPWNWTLHCASLLAFALTLLLHSYLLFATSLILLGAGFFDLKMPEPPKNRWFKFAEEGVEWEKDWVAYPWTFRKIWRFAFVVLVSLIVCWVLVTRELSALGMLMGFAYLIKVVRDNRESGIDL